MNRSYWFPVRSLSFGVCLFQRLSEWGIDSIAEFRCGIWDEGERRRGRCEELDIVVCIVYCLNVYKRVISGQIMHKPTIGLCGVCRYPYIAPVF
jgi:hypothetical protein